MLFSLKLPSEQTKNPPYVKSVWKRFFVCDHMNFKNVSTFESENKNDMNKKEIIRNGEGENYNYSQDHCFIKLSSRDTNGELCFVEDTLKPGFHLARHHHHAVPSLQRPLPSGREGGTRLVKAGSRFALQSRHQPKYRSAAIAALESEYPESYRF